MKVLAVTKLTERNQTTIPKRVRDMLKLTKEDSVLWIEDNDKIVVKKQ